MYGIRLPVLLPLGAKPFLPASFGLRTDGTDNDLDSEEDYQHITIFQGLGPDTYASSAKAKDELVVSNSVAGDAISALVIAIQMIATTCKKLQYDRKIVLVTDARAPMQADDLSEIISKMKGDNIKLVVLGVDFDDAEYGFKEESKDSTKADNEAILKTLCEDCSGTFGTLAQAFDELGVPRVKGTRPVHSYKGFLTLGNPEVYETALSINIERYPKVMQAKPPSASKFVIRGDMSASQPTQASSATLTDGEGTAADGLTAVKNARTYQVEDENAPGGKRDVESDELAKGYEYGRTAVHISESDRNVTTYETFPSLDIIGFVDKNQYERYLEMGRSNLIVSARNDDKASMELSSLIHALYELESFAVARLVTKENNQPKILLLAPNIEPEFECLYDSELPFAEDVRPYKFPPLDRVVTVSGKVLQVHRNLPNHDLQDAMSSYVDSMDLSTFSKDDEGEDAEYAAMDDTYSPMLHHVNQVIKHRAIYPNAEPPLPYEILTRYANPPPELVKQSQGSLDKVIKAADVKKVPPKARGKRFGRKGREEPKPLSDLDIGELLAQDPKRKTKRIDSKNAIPEFKQIIGNAEQISDIRDACTQLKNITFDWIRHSVGDSRYGKAIEAIRVMREEMNDMDEPGLFNDFLKDLKSKVLSEELGGDRKEMWYKVRVNRLGLISKNENEQSDVSEDDAKAFMSAK